MEPLKVLECNVPNTGSNMSEMTTRNNHLRTKEDQVVLTVMDFPQQSPHLNHTEHLSST